MAVAQYVTFLPSAFLEAEVQALLSAASAAISPSRSLTKNTIDPFGIIFEMSGFNIPSVSQWQINEKQRQAQKSLQNAIGTFHQNILGHIHHNGNQISQNLGNGHNSGMDVVVPSLSIIADVKNKFNTLNANGKLALYDKMYALVSPTVSAYHPYTAYYVEIISNELVKSQPNGIAFTPSDSSTRTKRAAHARIKQISGRNFYAMVTGMPNALDLLYDALPLVISNISAYSFSTADIAAINNYFRSACV